VPAWAADSCSTLGARIMELKKTAPTGTAQPSALKKAIDAGIT
jgi:hypothetical protein